MDKKRLSNLLIREAGIGIRRMIEHGECSHSFNMLNADGRTVTVLIVAAPSRLDYAIYEALKPIIESDGKVGVLVKPNPDIPRD